jgi:hypothetical protein
VTIAAHCQTKPAPLETPEQRVFQPQTYRKLLHDHLLDLSLLKEVEAGHQIPSKKILCNRAVVRRDPHDKQGYSLERSMCRYQFAFLKETASRPPEIYCGYSLTIHKRCVRNTGLAKNAA